MRTQAQIVAIHKRAAAERVALERQLMTQRSAAAKVDASAAAEAFVRAQEAVFRQNIARVKEAQARGLMSPEEARLAGRQAAQAYNDAVLGALTRRGAYQSDRGAYTTLAGSLKNLDEEARKGSLGMHRLNNSLIVMARQATNTHPVVGQLADVVGTFAIGTAAMVPILAGVAALGFAWQHLTRDAREAREEHEKLLRILEDISERRRIEALGPGGVAVDALTGGQEALADLTRQIQRQQTYVGQLERMAALGDEGARQRLTGGAGGGARGQLEELQERYREMVPLVQDAEREISDAVEDEAERRAREYEQETRRILAAFDDRVRAAQRTNALIETRFDQHFDERRRSREEFERGITEETERRLKAEEEQRKRELEAERLRLKLQTKDREEQKRAEQELARARDRANQALIRQLNEVGRAYGGVIDQILTLTATVLALEKMPMLTAGDKARAYGVAAGVGIGMGASTGSPLMGGLGGAGAGFAVAGPYGALVGGAAGIVSGFIEQGRRMEEARARWEKQFEAFEKMFQPQSPMDRGLEQLEAGFIATAKAAAEAAGGSITGLTSIDQLRALLVVLEQTGGPAERMADALREVVRQYDENLERLEEQIRLEQKRFGEDLQVRILRAQGLEEEAAALELALRQQREYQAAVEAGLDANTLATLRYTHSLEAEAAAKERLREEIDKTTRALNSPTGLNIALAQWRAAQLFVAPPPGQPPPTPPPPPGGGGGTPGNPYNPPPPPPEYPGDPGDDGLRGGTMMSVQTLNVTVVASPDHEATARAVFREASRQAARGAGSPFTTVTSR